MGFDLATVLNALGLMWKGMLGIFVVIVIIMVVVFILTKADARFPVKNDKDD